MKKYRISLVSTILLAFLIISACNLVPRAGSGPLTEETIAVMAAETMAAIQTEQGLNPTATAVQAAQVIEATATRTLAPSATLAPSRTPLPTPTRMATLTPFPTRTPSPSITPGASSGGGGGGGGSGFVPRTSMCLAGSFVTDVTIPDGTSLYPNSIFTKTWRVQNVGTCTWSEDFMVVFVDGDKMGGNKSMLGKTVKPGETIDVSVNMTSPEKVGEYTGFWMLRNPDGARFGVGSNASESLNVKIKVKKGEAPSGSYDLVASYCSAVWESSTEDSLPCPGEEGEDDGFVLLLETPDLENRKEDEPALWTNPADEEDGWIKGTFPAFKVEDDDRFLATIGCLDDYDKCSVQFELRYKIDGGDEEELGVWKEKFDEDTTRIDIDLSDLAGKSVQFILVVKTNGSPSEDAAFWLVPQVRRAE